MIRSVEVSEGNMDHIVCLNGQYLTPHYKFHPDVGFAMRMPKERAETLAKAYGATVANANALTAEPEERRPVRDIVIALLSAAAWCALAVASMWGVFSYLGRL